MTKIWYLTLAFFWYLRACFCILHIHIVMFSLDSPDLKWPNSAEIISLQSLGAWNEKLVQIGQNLASIKIYSFSNKRKLMKENSKIGSIIERNNKSVIIVITWLILHPTDPSKSVSLLYAFVYPFSSFLPLHRNVSISQP